MDEVITKVAIAVATAVIVGVGASLYRKVRGSIFDRRAVYRWLRKNTKDEPGEYHAATTEIAKGTRLSEERARHACMSDKRIYRAHGEIDLWSVWRQDPQSVYEKRGLLIV